MRLHTLMFLGVGFLLAAAPPGGDKDDQKRFQGVWALTAREFDGQAASKEDVRKLQGKITVEGDKITSTFGGDEAKKQATYKLDPSAKPRAIDITFQDGPLKGQTAQGIYELAGDTLKVCFGAPKGKRPTEFAAPAGTDHVLLIYQREKK
jgi:uncharacterized protein (TIGR03067 family)